MTTVRPMSSPEAAAPIAPALPAEDVVAAGVYASFAAGSERGLVVLAMGQSYWLMPQGDSFVLLVARTAAAAVASQLARFERESVGWPPAPLASEARIRPSDLLLPLLWAWAAIVAFGCAERWPALATAGALDAPAVLGGGEWWRLGTALWLHADSGHLLSNVVSGVFAFAAVTSTFGTRRGWSLLFFAALAGNLASAAAHYPAAYRSVGASTAIFAALGLLTGQTVRAARRAVSSRSGRGPLIPLSAGCTALALFGGGAAPVDLGAHLCGFTIGLALGFLVRARPDASTAPTLTTTASAPASAR